jgi:hypothetical protein
LYDHPDTCRHDVAAKPGNSSVRDLKSSWPDTWARLKGWSRGSGLPVLPPIGAVVELIVLVALIVAIDWAFPSLGFTSLEPSPFWLPVLLLSLQYGTVAGLLAAAAATAIYVFNGVAEQAVGENFFAYLLRIWALPILWIGVALVLGQFRLRQIAEKLELRQNLAKRTAEATSLTVYAKDLEARCQRLERTLTTRTAAPVKPVLDALARFTRAPADIDAALDEVSHSLWPGSQVSLFAVTPSGCELAARSGWPETASWATAIAATHPLYRAIVNDRRTVSILNRGDEAILSGHGVAAHPVLTADGGRVIGLFKIDAIDPALLGSESAAHLTLIARLLTLALTEPRSIAANDVTDAAPAETMLARLTRGWRNTHWRPRAGDATAPVHSGTADKSVRPRRST